MRKSTPENPAKNLLEWIVFGISSVLVVGVLVMLALAATQVEDGPPELRATAGKPETKEGWTRIPVTVENKGNSVASNVEVRVCTGKGEARREAGFTLDFVPRGASRNGAVSFKDTGEVVVPECEVLGYEEP